MRNLKPYLRLNLKEKLQTLVRWNLIVQPQTLKLRLDPEAKPQTFIKVKP